MTSFHYTLRERVPFDRIGQVFANLIAVSIEFLSGFCRVNIEFYRVLMGSRGCCEDI